MMSKVVYLPPTLAFLLLAWFVFSLPIRPVPTLIAVAVVALGAWLQFTGGRFTVMWSVGIVVHVLFSIAMLVRKQFTEY